MLVCIAAVFWCVLASCWAWLNCNWVLFSQIDLIKQGCATQSIYISFLENRRPQIWGPFGHYCCRTAHTNVGERVNFLLHWFSIGSGAVFSQLPILRSVRSIVSSVSWKLLSVLWYEPSQRLMQPPDRDLHHPVSLWCMKWKRGRGKW